MDSPATRYIRHRLQAYEHAIEEMIRHFPGPGSSDPLYASAPYQEKCAIPALLDSLPAGEPGRAALVEEYRRITEKLAAFAKENGPEYRDLLFEDLRQYAHAYHAAVCHASLGQTSPDRVRDLSRRDLIGELCRELGGSCDLSGIGPLITMLDDNLQGAAPVPEDSHGSTTVPRRCRSPADGEYSCPKKKTGHAHSE
jgi:hypothetical protein